LCRALGHRVALCAEFTLSYDIVFLALISISLNGEILKIKPRRCAVHPFKKRPVLEFNPSLILTAETGALLSYYHIIDDLHDSRGLRRLPPLLLLPAAKYMKRKIAPPVIFDNEIKAGLLRLNRFEAEKTASADVPAEAFGDILAAVFAHVCGEGSKRRIGEVIGRHTGRWIYLVDALDDLEKDKKRDLYNPFIYNGGISSDTAGSALTGELIQIEKAVSLIDFNDKGIENIIKNIIYLGMPRRAAEIIKKQLTDNT
jgi:hypothetical protein